MRLFAHSLELRRCGFPIQRGPLLSLEALDVHLMLGALLVHGVLALLLGHVGFMSLLLLRLFLSESVSLLLRLHLFGRRLGRFVLLLLQFLGRIGHVALGVFQPELAGVIVRHRVDVLRRHNHRRVGPG